MAQAIIETEETLIIETPERVQLEFALASIGNRFLAVTIDHFIQYLTIFVVAYGFLSVSGFTDAFKETGATSIFFGNAEMDDCADDRRAVSDFRRIFYLF